MEGQKELYDERVANYIESVRLWGFWFPDDELTWGKIIFVAVKLTFLSVICGSCFYGLSCYDSFGFAEGHFPFGPSLLVSVILQAIFVVKRNVHKELILSIEVILKEYNEPWMLESRKTPMDAYCRLFRYTFMVLNVANVFFYSTPSILIDAVGYGLLGWFSKPIVVPNSLSAYLEGTNLTSGVWFYALLPISALGTYVAVVVLVMSPQCFGNILLFLLSELTIIKKKIKILQTVEDPLKQSQMIRDIVKHQSSGIRLAEIAKDVIGIPCAIYTVFTSLLLTLTMFTFCRLMFPFRFESIPILLSWLSMFFLYLGNGWILCSVGQAIIDESNEIGVELMNIHWHRSTPTYRKAILMMIRQSQRMPAIGLVGAAPLNNETFLQIISSAYSYFTMVQSFVN